MKRIVYTGPIADFYQGELRLLLIGHDFDFMRSRVERGKDCKFLERVPKIKKDGTASKQNRLQCSIHVQHLFKGEKTAVCLKFKPKWED